MLLRRHSQHGLPDGNLASCCGYDRSQPATREWRLNLETLEASQEDLADSVLVILLVRVSVFPIAIPSSLNRASS